MFFVHFLFACFTAFILSVVFAIGFRRRSPWPSFLIFFIIILAVAVAWSTGIVPTGQSRWSIFWLPFLIVLGGSVLAFILAAAVAPERPRVKSEAVGKKVKAIFGVFFWVVLLALFATIIMHQIRFKGGEP